MNTRHLGLSLLVLASFFAFVIACKKTSNDGDVNVPESTMSYKIDGNASKFTTCIAIEQTNGASNTLSISAVTATDPDKALGIIMGSSEQIKAGFTFNQASISDSAQGIITYVQTNQGYFTLTTEDRSSALVEVHITEKTATHVKGTFTGRLYAQDAESELPAYTITEGQFNATIQKQ